MKQERFSRTVSTICLAVLFLFLLAIGVRTVTRQLVVKRLGITNALTGLILYDLQQLDTVPSGISINWEDLYPFPRETATIEKREPTLAESYINKVKNAEGSVEIYATDYLPEYARLVRVAKQYENMIHWNYTAFSEYNGVIAMKDGYLTNYHEQQDTREAANSTIDLANWCKEHGINFLFVQAPHKISKYEDTELSGIMDFSNQNADELLAALTAAGVDVYDIRETIYEEGLSHHELFYRTDHHWRGETGLWAARHILEELRDRYGFDIDASVLNEELFTRVNYPGQFLGSQGKKVTLARTTPDDFSLLYPTYETMLHYEVLSLDMKLDGDFSVLYNMSSISKNVTANAYGVYLYGNQPIEKIQNQLTGNDVRVLMIHDSFGDCTVPYLSMGVQTTDSMDVRQFTGSVRSFIEQTEPDVVVVLYNPGESFAIDPTTHTSPYDFR